MSSVPPPISYGNAPFKSLPKGLCYVHKISTGQCGTERCCLRPTSRTHIHSLAHHSKVTSDLLLRVFALLPSKVIIFSSSLQLRLSYKAKNKVCGSTYAPSLLVQCVCMENLRCIWWWLLQRVSGGTLVKRGNRCCLCPKGAYERLRYTEA